MKYSISLDLLLASVQLAHSGKLEKAAKLFDAAIRSKDLKQTVAALDVLQSRSLAASKKPTETASNKPKKTETAAQRMANFLEEINASRAKAKTTSGKKATGKQTAAGGLDNFKGKQAAPFKKEADTDTDEFEDTIDNMTATTVDQILDSDLDLVDDGVDDGGETPAPSGPRPTPNVADFDDGDPSNGMGESTLDTDQDDLMDIEDADFEDEDDFSDLNDLSDEDFLGAASDDDDEDKDEDDDKEDDDKDEDEDDSDSDSDSDSEDDKDDKKEDDKDDKDNKKDDDKGDKKENPFAKKDDKKEDASAARTNVKKNFSRTVKNLAALDRLSALTAGLVEKSSKQKSNRKEKRSAAPKK